MAKATKKSTEPQEEQSSKTSFMLRDSLSHKIKYISLMEGVSQSKIVDDALSKLVSDYEKKHGEIPVKK